ncbi:hypothetical protein AN958_01408 [Leucoagaricus sp. SymC.cos]|nr:hypothetical protein AN958_01408 [Leucoagaricus sp. SymC.cos]
MFRRKSKFNLRKDNNRQEDSIVAESVSPSPSLPGLQPSSSERSRSSLSLPLPMDGPIPAASLSTTPLPMPPLPPMPAMTGTALQSGVIDEALPPGYETIVLVPNKTVKYQFSNLGPNCMLLSPTSEYPNMGPMYHIAVSMNCFVPYSYITTMTRGCTADGEVVGDFEQGELVDTSVRKPIVNFRGRGYPMDKLMSRSKMKWTWLHPLEEMALGKSFFTWDCTHWRDTTPVFSLRGSPFTLLASFTPQTPFRQCGQPNQPSTLEVTPEGHKYFDELILSLLIVEAERSRARRR